MTYMLNTWVNCGGLLKSENHKNVKKSHKTKCISMNGNKPKHIKSCKHWPWNFRPSWGILIFEPCYIYISTRHSQNATNLKGFASKQVSCQKFSRYKFSTGWDLRGFIFKSINQIKCDLSRDLWASLDLSVQTPDLLNEKFSQKWKFCHLFKLMLFLTRDIIVK